MDWLFDEQSAGCGLELEQPLRFRRKRTDDSVFDFCVDSNVRVVRRELEYFAADGEIFLDFQALELRGKLKKGLIFLSREANWSLKAKRDQRKDSGGIIWPLREETRF